MTEKDVELLLRLFDALSGCYLIVLDRSGAVRALNRAFLDTVGLTADEAAGQPVDFLEQRLSGIREQFAELRSHASRTFHARLVDRHGQALFVEQTLVLLDEETIVCVGHDLSRLNGGQESALRKAEQQLMTANRLKRKFIANINHAIRTPMNAIIGYAEMLAESDLDEQQQRFVSTIRKNSAALVSIINDVMELSKLETGSVRVLKSAANLKLVVEQAADLFTDQIRAKKLDFVCTIEPGLPEMYVMDADHCRQILMNLISNGVKFTDRGRVSLSVTGARTGPDWYDLFFQVTDTGSGMSAEEQQSILELFAQQEEQISIHDGTRLGLTLCARLARMMGGGIRLESAQGRGSTFIFTMPVKAAGRAAPEVQPAPQQAAAGPPARQPVLLVVDDMPEMSHLVKIYFTNSPIQVLEASGRPDCLRLAMSARPDLILMDLDLAGTDGREVALALKADSRTAHIPLAVMTGLMPEQQDSFMPPFNDFLAKPFHLQDLQKLVDRYIKLPRSGPAEAPLAPDLERIRAAWRSELDAAYAQAQMSGSLDDAFALGQKMEECGLEAQAAELTAMGREMRKFALDLDIRGVEQILTALRGIAEAGR